jgi:hypothetical protein
MNELPKTKDEADERLITALKHYVLERDMPIRAAKCLMRTNIKNHNKLKETWKRFIQTVGQNA